MFVLHTDKVRNQVNDTIFSYIKHCCTFFSSIGSHINTMFENVLGIKKNPLSFITPITVLSASFSRIQNHTSKLISYVVQQSETLVMYSYANSSCSKNSPSGLDYSYIFTILVFYYTLIVLLHQ